VSSRTRILRWSRAKLALFGIAAPLILSGALAGHAVATSIGIYSDPSGSSCSLSALTVGTFVDAYVVVRPGPQGVSAVQFAAPKPDCFAATWVSDQPLPGTLVLGNSQTGISISLQGCSGQTTHVLTMQYYVTGTTPSCCEFPIVADPTAGGIMAVDCAFNTETATGVVSRVNPDPSCECVGNTAPLAPGGPTPQDGHDLISIFTGLSWQAFDVDGDITGFDLYFGTSTHPPLVASNLPSPS
jgi:hypothetical protein